MINGKWKDELLSREEKGVQVPREERRIDRMWNSSEEEEERERRRKGICFLSCYWRRTGKKGI